MTRTALISAAWLCAAALTLTACTAAPASQEAPMSSSSARPHPAPTVSDQRAATTARSVLATAGLWLPEDWQPASVRRERHDDRPVMVVRFQATADPRPGGEHVTTVLDDHATLLGYTRMVANPTTHADNLPDHDQAREQAMRWLNNHAPGYTDGLTVNWVDQHNETITDTTGAKRTISGIKIKTQHESGLYAWVIVDARGQVLTYERDIRWDSAAGRRATQMWLHDKWTAAHDEHGPQPAPPYALAD